MKALLLLILLTAGFLNHKALACDCGPQVHPDMSHDEWVRNNSLIAGAGALFGNPPTGEGAAQPSGSSSSPNVRAPASSGGSRSSGFTDGFFNGVGRDNSPEPDSRGSRRPLETR